MIRLPTGGPAAYLFGCSYIYYSRESVVGAMAVRATKPLLFVQA